MRRMSQVNRLVAAIGLVTVGAVSVFSPLAAQPPTLPTRADVGGSVPPGSPAAKASINPLCIPNPLGAFGGEINLDARSSSPYWQPQVVPPKGAPNILLVLIDDEGFGAPSTFGGVIPTPQLDRIASTGLRYTLCQP